MKPFDFARTRTICHRSFRSPGLGFAARGRQRGGMEHLSYLSERKANAKTIHMTRKEIVRKYSLAATHARTHSCFFSEIEKKTTLIYTTKQQQQQQNLRHSDVFKARLSLLHLFAVRHLPAPSQYASPAACASVPVFHPALRQTPRECLESKEQIHRYGVLSLRSSPLEMNCR